MKRNGRDHPVRWRKAFRRFRQNSRGAAALEFALIAPIHLALILAILEAGLLCTRIALVEDAVARSAKYIYLGTQPGVTVTQDGLEAYICGHIGRFMTECTENVTVELTPVSDFQSPPQSDAQCRDSAVELDPAVQFNVGGSNSVVFMRVCVSTPVVTPGLGLGLNLTKTSTNKYEIVSSLAFMNEPF